MKMKILSIVSVMIISAVCVGFTPKLEVQLVNDTISITLSKILKHEVSFNE